MPRPPVRVALLRERPGERVVGGTPVVRWGVVVDRRAQQGVAELDRPVTDRDDARLLGGSQPRRVRADRRDGVVDRRHRGLVARGCHEQRPPRLGREREDAALVDAAHAGGSGERADDRLAPRTLLGGKPVRQRRERQGVSAGVAPEVLDHVLRGDALGEQLAHLVEREPTEAQLIGAAVIERARPVRPLCGDQRDPADVQAARDECQRVGRAGVEVMGIVDHEQHRLLARCRDQQAQRAREHLEAVVGLGLAESERAAQCAGLHRRDHVEPGEHGSEQLVQPREGKIRLCGHPLCREHAPAVRLRGDLCEQLALADSGLADHDERPSAPDARFLQHRLDAASLGDPSDEH